jgi:hypothetical protein
LLSIAIDDSHGKATGKCLLFLSDSNQTGIFPMGFSNPSPQPNIKYHENPSSGSPVIPCRRTNGRTGMTILKVTCRNFARAPKYEFDTFFFLVD